MRSYDYVWSNGTQQIPCGHNLTLARLMIKDYGGGRVWCREFEDGILEGIRDVTVKVKGE